MSDRDSPPPFSDEDLPPPDMAFPVDEAPPLASPSVPAAVAPTPPAPAPAPARASSKPASAPPGSTLLYSVEAEEAVLGSILINPEAYLDVVTFLKAEDFFLDSHRWIWQAIGQLNDKRLPLDLLTLAQELDAHNHLAPIGGLPYLTKLVNSVPTSLHVEAYGRLVQRDALRRRLLDAATQVAKLAYEEGRDINEVINEAEAAVFAVAEQRLNKDLVPIREPLANLYQQVEYRMEHQGELFGVPTHFYDLDKVLGGLQKSDLLIVAGRPGSGKTGFMLSVAKNAAQLYRKHVAIFSLEMGNEQLVQRMLAQETAIDAQRLRLGQLRDNEVDLFSEAVSKLSDIPIFLDDTPALTPLQLRAKCRRLEQEYGLDLIIVDYLQLMQGEGRNENRVQEVSYISRSLKQLARELNVPLLAGAQLSRAVEQRTDKTPQLSDLRESGSLEQDADIVMFIHRPDMYENKDGPRPELTVSQIVVAKHRNGPTATVDLLFRSRLAKFENAATYPRQE